MGWRKDLIKWLKFFQVINGNFITAFSFREHYLHTCFMIFSINFPWINSYNHTKCTIIFKVGFYISCCSNLKNQNHFFFFYYYVYLGSLICWRILMTVICLYYQNTSKSIVIYHLFFLMGLKSVMEMKGSRINPPLSLSTPCTCVWCFLVLIRLKMNLTSELTNKCHLHQSTLITGHKLYFFFFILCLFSSTSQFNRQ